MSPEGAGRARPGLPGERAGLQLREHELLATVVLTCFCVKTEPPTSRVQRAVSLVNVPAPLVLGDENTVQLSHRPCVFPAVCPVPEARVRKLLFCPRTPLIESLARGTG